MKKFLQPELLSTRKTCRVCANDKLEEIISLGNQNIINFLDSEKSKSFTAPLDLILCSKEVGGCGLLQLRHTVPSDLLYREFWYKSGVNQTIKNDLKEIVQNAEKLMKFEDNDIVIDIGANDGTLLRNYQNKLLQTVGFEPATNLMAEARVNTTKIVNDFFTAKKFSQEFPNKKAKIITSISMFYDLEDPNEFVDDVVQVLDDNGIWILQMNYLVSMLEKNAFDNIVHEHLEYYSLQSLESLLDRHDLVVFNVEENNINGGSIRAYIKHKNCRKFPVSPNVKKARDYEEKSQLESIQTYNKFADRIKQIKKQVYDYISSQVENGKSVYIYGASTRGNTLLQYFGLDDNLIKFASERNPAKWGKKIVGTNIEIISEEQARKDNPDYMLVLPWYFIDEFILREKSYLENGGKFIVPLPEFRII